MAKQYDSIKDTLLVFTVALVLLLIFILLVDIFKDNLTHLYSTPSTLSELRIGDPEVANGILRDNEVRNLVSQHGMWRASNYLVLLALLQFLVGMLTVFVIWRTLVTQQNELRQTILTNEQQLKPYIQFVDAEIQWRQLIKYYYPCIAVRVQIQNTGSTVALKLSKLKLSGVTIVLNNVHSGKLDDIKYNTENDIVLERSSQHRVGVSHANDIVKNTHLQSLLSNSPVARNVLNPGETLEYTEYVPMKDIPLCIKVSDASVRCKSWTIKGEISFSDSFSKEKTRKCIVFAHHASTNESVVSMGDGTSMTVGGKSTMGRIEELIVHNNF